MSVPYVVISFRYSSAFVAAIFKASSFVPPIPYKTDSGLVGMDTRITHLSEESRKLDWHTMIFKNPIKDLGIQKNATFNYTYKTG
jgi:hypothetical protein